jgi:hypothetical protein
MEHLKLTILALVLVSVFSTVSVAQPPTTAKTFRMYTDATHSVSIMAGGAIGTGTFTWPQPGAGIFKSDISGNMSLSLINLGTGSTDITGILNVSNGGTGNGVIGGAGSIAFSDGTKINYTAVGTVGQVLQSNAGATPTWVTLPGQLIAKGRVPGDGVNFSYLITPSAAIPAGATIMVTLESVTNSAITVTARTGTTFTVQAPVILGPSDFINYLIF